MQVAVVLSVQTSEYKVNILVLVCDVRKDAKIFRETLARQHSAWWIGSHHFVCARHSNNGRVGLRLELLVDLFV